MFKSSRGFGDCKDNRRFTVMSNYRLRDKKLSNEASGLLSTMLSLSDDWDYTVEGLASNCKDGKGSIATQLNCFVFWNYLQQNIPTNVLLNLNLA